MYVACLAAYNNGVLYGRWIDANQDPYDIWNEVSTMLLASPIEDAEEWAIHDHDGFEGAPISEYECFEEVSQKAALISEHGALAGKLLDHFSDFEEAREALSDRYAGEYECLADFARELTEETAVPIPENVAFYIDYECMARDLEISDVLTVETRCDQVHVFWAH
ncbi:MAG: antirestriction protein ArdA [Erythrobacter sp.]|uniref:antirestriction protein ArdA n=1 Tax=Erythrobacter sp. TaxID=1042 RepID=UPI0032969FC0